MDHGFPVWVEIVCPELDHEVGEGECEQPVAVTTNPVTDSGVSKTAKDFLDLVICFYFFAVKKV